MNATLSYIFISEVYSEQINQNSAFEFLSKIDRNTFKMTNIIDGCSNNRALLNYWSNALYLTLFGHPNLEITFSEPATQLMVDLIDFYHNLTMFLILFFTFLLFYLMIALIYFRKSTNNFTFFFVPNLPFFKFMKIPTYKNKKSSMFVNYPILELLWISLPSCLFFLLTVPSIFFLTNSTAYVDPHFTLKIIGRQWGWIYEYKNLSNQIIQIDTTQTARLLNLPLNKNIRLLVTSIDVIHSWTIPAFGIKIDAVPGKLTERFLRINKSGMYFGYCSEICGIGHNFMPINISVPPLAVQWSNNDKLRQLELHWHLLMVAWFSTEMPADEFEAWWDDIFEGEYVLLKVFAYDPLYPQNSKKKQVLQSYITTRCRRELRNLIKLNPDWLKRKTKKELLTMIFWMCDDSWDNEGRLWLTLETYQAEIANYYVYMVYDPRYPNVLKDQFEFPYCCYPDYTTSETDANKKYRNIREHIRNKPLFRLKKP